MNFSTLICENCDRVYSGDHCPMCVIKCQYCDVILGEDEIDSYFIGSCPHLVCFEDLNNEGIYWINNELENRFKFYCEENNNDRQINSNQEQLLFSSRSEKVLFKQFAAIERIEMIEHKLYANDGRYNPVFFYIIREG